MYSANGRVKKETSNINIPQKKQHLVCKDCGYIMEGMSKEFGENMVCPKCGGHHLEYELD